MDQLIESQQKQKPPEHAGRVESQKLKQVFALAAKYREKSVERKTVRLPKNRKAKRKVGRPYGWRLRLMGR